MLEAHTITGSGDLLCRIVARSNADLQRVIDQIVAYEGIVRASTIIALAEQIPYRVLPLVRSAAVERAGRDRYAGPNILISSQIRIDTGQSSRPGLTLPRRYGAGWRRGAPALA